MIRDSGPMKKLSNFTKHLKSKGYYIVGLQSSKISLKNLLVASIEAANRGGRKVKQVSDSNNLKEKSKGKTVEGVNDPVTEGDLLSHNEMYFSLKNTWPQLSIVSEEKDSSVANNVARITKLESQDVNAHLDGNFDAIVDQTDVLIWIDPLDATKEYSEKLLKYVTTMVCITVRGKPVIGIIHKPFSGETFWAWSGRGHNLQYGRKTIERKSPIITVSRSHAGGVNKTATTAFGDQISVIPAGGAGYKVIELVMGRVDAYLHITKIKKWDVCAGNAILTALNGKMTDLKGNLISYGNAKDVEILDGMLATMKDHEKFLKPLSVLKV